MILFPIQYLNLVFYRVWELTFICIRDIVGTVRMDIQVIGSQNEKIITKHHFKYVIIELLFPCKGNKSKNMALLISLLG